MIEDGSRGTRRGSPLLPAGVANSRRALSVSLAMVCLAAATCGLIMQPYSLVVPALVCGVITSLSAIRPLGGLTIALSLMPVADLTASTGMLYVTESDLVVLCAVAGGFLRFGVRTMPPSAGNGLPPSGLLVFSLVLLVFSYLASSLHVLASATSWDVTALSGYASPLNAARLAKGLLLGILLVCFLRSCILMSGNAAILAMRNGLVAGVVLVGVVALWERLAFTSLTDMATDYRVTASFWEMHVGGAQLDAWLALTSPFALWWLLRNRNPWMLAVLALCCGLVFYAAAVSFSRGLYGAVALEVVLLTIFSLTRASSAGTTGPSAIGPFLGVLAMVLCLAYPAFLVFETAGYRGLAALLASAAVVFGGAPFLGAMGAVQVAGHAAAGATVAVVLGWLAAFAPKGPYLVFGLSILGALALIGCLHQWRGGRENQLQRALASTLGAAVALVPAVATHWGGEVARGSAVVAALLAMVPLVVCRVAKPSLWRLDTGSVTVALAGLSVLGVAAVLGHSFFMETRFSSASADLGGRRQHWEDGLGLIESPRDWLLGLGAGSYAAAYAGLATSRLHSGEFRVFSREGRPVLSLTGPSRPADLGSLVQVSQRVSGALEPPLVAGIEIVSAEAPQGGKVPLFLGVCRKHLLYIAECTEVYIEAPPGSSRHDVVLPARGLGEETTLGVARTAVFFLGLASVGGRAEIASVQLIDAHGRSLLKNADFSDGGAWWFFSVDRHHLPFHAKNLWLHFLIEQGAIGLIAIIFMGLSAMLWISIGPGRTHPWAPPWLAALLGLGVVGLFDSVMDAPRLTALVVLMCGGALSLRSRA